MTIRFAAIAAALAWTAAAAQTPLVNQPMTQEEARLQKVRIEEQYDHSQARCRRLQGPARELCNEQARGERDIQSAELEMRMQPSADNDEKVRLARAEAAYSVALLRCKPFDRQAREVCRQDARSTFDMARQEARLQKEVVAQTLRSEMTVRERTAEADRRTEAQFQAARARCEVLPAEGRLACLNDAKTRFGRL